MQLADILRGSQHGATSNHTDSQSQHSATSNHIEVKVNMVQLAIILAVSQHGATINHTGSQSQHVAISNHTDSRSQDGATIAIILMVEVHMMQLTFYWHRK